MKYNKKEIQKWQNVIGRFTRLPMVTVDNNKIPGKIGCDKIVAMQNGETDKLRIAKSHKHGKI